MIRRVVLKNFMAHAHTELELVDGLNVLVGPNNCGKSALVAALQILATLPTREGDYMVRHDASDCSVTVETSENHVLTWKRKKSGAPVLVLDGEELTRLANDQEHVLSRLQPLLRLPQVSSEDGTESFDVHFALQKDPIFLLGKESQAATFFASSSDAERLLKMQSRFKERVRQRKQERAQLQRQLAELVGKLQALAPLDQLAPRIRDLHIQHDSICGNQKVLGELTALLDETGQIMRHLAILHDEHRILSSLSPPPTLVDEAPLEQILATLAEATRRQKRLAKEADILTELREVPTLEDESPLQTLVRSMEQGNSRFLALRAELGTLHPLKDPPALQETEGLEALLRHLREASGKYRDTERQLNILGSLKEPPRIEDTSQLDKDLRTLREQCEIRNKTTELAGNLSLLHEPPELADETPLHELCENWAEMIEHFAQATKALKVAEDEFKNWVDENPYCPHCGSRITQEEETGGYHGHS